MKSAGVILTFMSKADFIGKSLKVKLRTAFFNLCLFVGQMIFMIAGTAYGKVKWPKQWLPIRIVSIFGIMAVTFSMIASVILGWWLILSFDVIMFVLFVACYRGIDWRKVWRAAQCSHVRLVLEKWTTSKVRPYRNLALDAYAVANFGYPRMEIQPWRERWCNGKRFEYRRPTFETSDKFIEAMIEYAEAQVGKLYDHLQLISDGLHLIAWIAMPWWWGQELRIIKALNRKGGLEVCSSGTTADLRWADEEAKFLFFNDYDTAMVWPCMFAIDRNWREE